MPGANGALMLVGQVELRLEYPALVRKHQDIRLRGHGRVLGHRAVPAEVEVQGVHASGIFRSIGGPQPLRAGVIVLEPARHVLDLFVECLAVQVAQRVAAGDRFRRPAGREPGRGCRWWWSG